MLKYHEIILCGLIAWLTGPAARAAVDAVTTAQKPSWDLYSDMWVATDGLGRTLPTFEDVGPPKPDKTAVMFYYLWEDDDGVGTMHDMAKELAKNPDFRAPVGPWWWWGEPLLGYYLLKDPFVTRTHASLLTDAGIDAIMFDTTNGFIHEPQYLALCKTYESIRAYGQKTPLIGHVTHANSAKTVQSLYDKFYSKNLYPDLWFRWDGKPLILSESATLSPQLKDFFTVRDCWAWHSPKGWFGDGHDKWAWIDTYPQQYGWDKNPQTPEEISVSAAQHPSSTIGRSYTYAAGHEPPPDQRQPAQGLYFAEQWKQALKVSPQAIFITNWNEWIAKSYTDDKPHGKPRNFLGHPMAPGEGFLVDEYDPEFSRDIEPAAPTPANRGVDDNYYYEMVAALRHYKGVRPLPAVKPVPIKIDGSFDDWKSAAPEFRDTIGDPVQRDFDGYPAGSHYVNHTGRNDIVSANVSYDATNIYFHVHTREKMSPHTDPNWMVLYLDVDQSTKTGWLGYDFVINRIGVGDRTTTLEQNTGGYHWKAVSNAIAYAVDGNDLELALPRALLGSAGQTAGIDFKWADNTYEKGDWTDFTLNGDAAPNARFNYRAKLTGN